MITLRPVLNILGLLIFGLGAGMLLPAVVDVAARNPDWQAFVISALFTGMSGLLLAISCAGELGSSLSIRQAFLLTALAWLTLPAFGALPFLWLGISYADAVFEAVSGFTTTGSTILIGLDGLAPGLLLWRSVLQWMGGVGIIVMALVLLPYLQVGGMQLFKTESSDKGEKVVSRSADLVRLIALIYFGLTMLCAALYWVTGMNAFDAVNHAMTTLSTGGYSTHDASFAYFTNPLTGWICIVFMIAGASPFSLMIQAMRGRPLLLWRDPQIKALLCLLAATSFVAAIYLGITQEIGLHEALLRTSFNFTSIVTTTGFALGDYTLWGPPIVGIVLMLTFAGGCTGSTSGGIKMFRFIVFFGTLRNHLRMMVRTHRVVSTRYADTQLTPDIAFSVLAFLVAYLGSVGAITLILTFFGLDAMTAITGAATAIGNVGPGLGDVIGPAGNFSSLPDGAKWVLSLAMLLGRLELFTVLVLLDPEFWSR
ncbi:TrkH family potassium uptake protein [Stappia albiluteola]|uniref:TrkH family potassium uptake protein n=1 Tax=Stappia albiluteola TaxID=2758565 RepID=UPI002E2E2526|nr:TrkH family potassium uptake protein [Stappia albiluteola]